MGKSMTGGFRDWWSGIARRPAPDRDPLVENSPTRTMIAPTPWLCAITEIGTSRTVNEDAFRLGSDGRVWVVADGMGGQKCGEIASQLSVDTFLEAMCGEMKAEEPSSTVSPELRLRRALALAHRRVLSRSTRDENCRGMGSALVAGYVVNDVLHVGHAGDTRAYLFRAGDLKRLTIDHSVVAAAVMHGDMTWEEARSHPNRSKLCQAVGVNKPFEPSFVSFPLLPGDKSMMCSDGVWALLSGPEIEQVLGSDVSLPQMAQILVNRALAAGGHDNITLVLYEHSTRRHFDQFRSESP